ncbi:MAG: epoxyqueuosine reductase [Deltaproteobacteria bacterium]|nr:epoxyqueuosine reductase [Deltaproteobacteria bacterium]
MVTKKEIIEKAYECGFGDIGFTTAEPFEVQKTLLEERRPTYEWVAKSGLDLWAGTDPKAVFSQAKSIIVLVESYFNQAFPSNLERYFGRCYLDDDRIIKNNLSKRTRTFRDFLTENGIVSKIPPHLPQKIAAARAGLGTYGKNCLFYSNKLAARGSWVTLISLTVDQEFEPDEPTLELGCPDWCKNTCLTACPTGALKGPRHLDPQRCVSYLSYYGRGITPLEWREPMGLRVYGCDHCQNVCPRNAPWLARERPLNPRVEAKADDFRLEKLLHMDQEYFRSRIWPHMFYMSENEIWRWKMNVARAMGNSLDEQFIPDLGRAFRENEDERVLGLMAWAMGRIGGSEAKKVLTAALPKSQGLVREEIEAALEKL